MIKPDIYLGVNIMNERIPFTFCALDTHLHLLEIAQGELEELMEFVGRFPSVFIAINAPSRTNKGLMKMAEVRKHLKPTPSTGHWNNLRILEYELRRRGIHAPRTPGDPADCPSWMRLGFAVYKQLHEIGFSAYPDDERKQQWLEVQAETSFCALLGRQLMEGHTLEGRLQRQMILFDNGLGIRDPMLFFEEVTSHRLMYGNLPMNLVYELKELNSLAAAFTAWLAANRGQQVISLGAVEEGQAVIPASGEFENATPFRQMSIFGSSDT